MTHLVACPSCNRHVRAHQHTSCPFCDAELGSPAEPRPGPPRGLSRARVMAFGAALAAAPLTACGSGDDSGSGGTSGTGGSAGASTGGSGGSTGGSGGSTGGSGGSSGGSGGATGGSGGDGGGGNVGGSGGFSGMAQPYGIPPLRDPSEPF